METIPIILFGVMVIGILIVVLLSIILKKTYSKKKGKNKAKKTLKQRIKAIKPEQYVIFLVYIVIFAIAGYFIIANYFPDNPINDFGDYGLSADSIAITNELRSLYLDKDYVLGGKTEINNQTARLIVSEEPFNFVFNPKRVIEDNETAEIQLLFLKPKTDVYFNDKLIIPNLEGYEKIKDFSNENKEVWIKKELTKDNYKTADKAEDFIYANFPENSIYSFAELDGGAPIIQDYEKTSTKISTQFRDNLKLAVYAENALDIEFIKQDLNGYIGADEYTVEITNYQDEEMFKRTYKDDGDKKDTGTSGEEQDFEINLRGLVRNIYYIKFTKDKYNPSSDSTIKDIKINSNKILILGTSLLLDNFDFYTKVSSPKTISFKYIWGKEQNIYQTGAEKKTIKLDEDWKDKKYEQELNIKGDYNFEINVGYVWVYSDVISLSKENWFYFPQKADSKLIDSDIIIIDKNKLEINENNIFYKEQLEISEDSKFKIQVLDKTKIYFKEIKLVL